MPAYKTVLKSWLHSERSPAVLVTIAAILRLAQYVRDRPLWFDEAALAANLDKFRFSSPFATLSMFDQAAPPGFLVLSKAAIGILGNYEWVLRLTPLVAGLIALPLFWIIANKLLDRRAAILALIAFAFSARLIEYSNEFKQYSLDVLIALGVLWMGIWLIERAAPKLREYLVAAVFGSTVIFLSHAAIFSLAAVGAVLAYITLRSGSSRKLVFAAMLNAAWLLAFATLYLLNLRYVQTSAYLQAFWEHTFLPFPPTSLADVQNGFFIILRLFTNPFAVQPSHTAFVFCLVGIVASFRRNVSRTLLLLGPFLFACAASALHKYPLGDRLALFLLPAATMLMADGVLVMCSSALRLRYGKILALACVLLFLVGPVSRGTGAAFVPRIKQDVRPAIKYLAENMTATDVVFLEYMSAPASIYYAQRFGVDPGRLIISPQDSPEWPKVAEVDSLVTHKRVWVLQAPLFASEAVLLHNQRLIDILDSKGRRAEDLNWWKTRMLLYEFSGGDGSDQ